MTRPFHRRVFYIPGYDPMPPRRYRELYRREAAAQAAISGHRIVLVPRPAGAPGFGWGVEAVIEDRPATATVEVLVWDDIVQGSMGRGIAATYGQLLRTAWIYVGSGTLMRMMRLRRGPVIAALYPIAMLILQALVAVALGAAVGWVVARFHLLPGLAAGVAVAWAVLALFRRADGRLFAYYLMHDYAFTAALNGAAPSALTERAAQFAARIRSALTEDADEVLVIGHSSGAIVAIMALADLTRDHRPAGPALSLLTLGHVVPMMGLLPRAEALRDDLRHLAAQQVPFWMDVTAPGDACCFALCDPAGVCGAAPEGQTGPLILSAAFSNTLSAERQAAMRFRWFRRHFQYLCAFDRPAGYDYFAITAGGLTLAQRFAGRPPSPGRITRAVRP